LNASQGRKSMSLEWLWFTLLSGAALWLSWQLKGVLEDPDATLQAEMLGAFVVLAFFFCAVSVSLAISWDSLLGVAYDWLGDLLPLAGTAIHETTRKAAVLGLALAWAVALLRLPYWVQSARSRCARAEAAS
jgi:hypothetical protein